jgi:tRNA 2-selenouridine synthase
MFESKLAVALKSFDPARPVWIEAESSKVGDLAVPCALWKSMCAAPRLFVTLPLEARVARILDDYSYWVENPKKLKVVLERLRRRHGTQTLDRWNSLIDAGRSVLAMALPTQLPFHISLPPWHALV